MTQQSPQYRIGDAARLSGVSAANIRYYEKEGLLQAQARADNRYRIYSNAEVHRLRFVRLCRAMDMSLDEVRSLLVLDVAGTGTNHAACTTLDAHLEHVRMRLQELRTLRTCSRSPRRRASAFAGWDARRNTAAIALLLRGFATTQTARKGTGPTGWGEIGRFLRAATCLHPGASCATSLRTHPDCTATRCRRDREQVLRHELLSLRSRCDGTGGQCHVIEALHERADAQPLAAATPAVKRHV